MNFVMKKIIATSCLLLLMTGAAHSKSRERKLQEIRGQWELTEDDYVAFRQVYEFPDKTESELFDLSERFIKRNYTDREVTESDEAEGYLRKHSLFSGAYTTYRMFEGESSVSTAYDLVVEVKGTRVRVSVIMDYYSVRTLPSASSGSSFITDRVLDPVSLYPVNPRGKNKDFALNLFYNTYTRAQRLIASYQQFVSSRGEIEPADDNW